MAFQLIVLAAALACVNAGGLAAVGYSPAASVSTAYLSQAPIAVASPLAYASPSIGATQQSVVRSYGGNQAVSHYAKAVDSAFSSVRKYDTRITNDALTAYAHAAPVATYAHAAPVATYAHAAPIATYAQAAPVATYGQAAYAAPVATYSQAAYAAPVATYAHAAPVATYAHAAPIATYAHAGPVVAKAALAYSPAVAVSHMSFTGLGTNYAW